MARALLDVGRSAWRIEEVIFWLGTLALAFFFPGYIPLLTQIVVVGLFALSLDLLVGYAGLASLGHSVFFGVGAYTTGILTQRGWGEPLSGLAAAVVASGLVGYLFGLLLYKVRGIAFLIVTLGLGLFFLELATQLKWLTGGDDGLQDVAVWPIFGVVEWDFLGRTAFGYTFVVCLAVYVLARLVTRSNFGMAIEAVRENEVRAKAIGIPAIRRLRMLVVLSAAIAGIAGGLYAQATQFVALDVLSLDRSVSALVMVTLGGLGTAIGAMIGAATFLWARDLFASLAPVYWNFWIGLLLFAIVCMGQNGILGLTGRLASVKLGGRTRTSEQRP